MFKPSRQTHATPMEKYLPWNYAHSLDTLLDQRVYTQLYVPKNIAIYSETFNNALQRVKNLPITWTHCLPCHTTEVGATMYNGENTGSQHVSTIFSHSTVDGGFNVPVLQNSALA